MSDRVTALATVTHPIALAFVRTAMVLDSQAREHKRLEKAHRRGAQQCRQTLADLKRDAARAGYPINITGEAEEEAHGPEHHHRDSAYTGAGSHHPDT